jgi:hypothetical protein
VPHACLVGPVGKVGYRLPVRAAGSVGAHRNVIAPDGQGPEREVGVALDCSGDKTIRLADLCDRPVRVENEEREEADGSQPKARDTDQAY